MDGLNLNSNVAIRIVMLYFMLGQIQNYALRCSFSFYVRSFPIGSQYRKISSRPPRGFSTLTLNAKGSRAYESSSTSLFTLSSSSSSPSSSSSSSSEARAPPIEPISFGKEFVIHGDDDVPMHLQKINAHENDHRLDFDEVHHKYTYDGVSMDYSVTQIVESFFEKFETDKVIERMMSGRNWPRPEYTWENGAPYTAKEIKSKWAETGLYARNRGSWMHYNIERYFNGLTYSRSIEELEQFFEFKSDFIDNNEIVPYRTEWRLAAPNLRMAGTVDFIGRTKDGEYILLDWKRAKDLESNLVSNWGKRAKVPINYLDDCTGSKYFLQLNLYKFMLRNYYGLNVSKMVIVSFHPDLKGKYFMVEAPNMEKEIDAIINQFSNTGSIM